jgi:hypothetical protein
MAADDDRFPEPCRPSIDAPTDLESLLPYARDIAARPGGENNFLTTGYGMVGDGDDALVVVRSLHDDMVVEAVITALRERGVTVDRFDIDIGPDGERTTTLDVDLAITENPAEEDAYNEFLGRAPWLETVAAEQGYDLLIETTAGPIPWEAHKTGDPYYVERIPWQSPETMASPAAHFPADLLRLITRKTRELIYEHGVGADVRITDPEGTDLRFTLHEEYFRNDPAGTDIDPDVWEEYYDEYDWPRREFTYPDNHVAGKPWPPLIDRENASGVIASTLGHHSKPYPRIELDVEDGRVTEIRGGGDRGDRLREIHERTRDVRYPDFPGDGLLWVWECSIGTNPKAFRPSSFTKLSESGTLTERLRSGVIHIGVGTLSLTRSRDWAREHGEIYGHVDHHMNFPTYEILTDDGPVTVVEDGRLTVLDDPAVRDAAAEYGDPDELLREAWVPPLPGVNVEGSYETYAETPAAYLSTTDYRP